MSSSHKRTLCSDINSPHRAFPRKIWRGILMIHAGRLISTGRTSHRRFLSVCFLGYIRRKTLTSSRGGLSRRTQAPSPFPVRPGRPDDRVDGFAGGGGDPRRIPPEPLWSFLQFSPFIFNIDKLTDVYTYKRKPCIPFEHGTAAIARQQERENDSRTRIMVNVVLAPFLSPERPHPYLGIYIHLQALICRRLDRPSPTRRPDTAST